MNKAGKAWSSEEIQIIVADYLEMLRTELAGGKFNKADRNRVLQWKIGRSKGSIEYGDGAGYDILSFNRNGDGRLLEVKTINGPETAPFPRVG